MILVVVGLGLLLLSALPVQEHSVSGIETDVFDLVNDLPGVLYPPLYPVMQLGNFFVIPVAALVALAFRRVRLAVGLLLGGLMAYVLAKLVKDIWIRGRPLEVLDDVTVHGAVAEGRGFVSGHAAVVVALTVIASPYLSRRGRVLLWVVVVLVGASRVYVGAHLPLDVIGGAGLGLACGGAVRLMLGRPVVAAPSVTSIP